MKIKIDKEVCIGCGTCTFMAPKTFKLAEDGKAETIEPYGDDETAINDACSNCPVQCITIEK